MRYHRTVARIRHVIFAFQLLRTISFIFVMQEELAEAAAEFFDAEVALDESAVADRDLSGFLGNHDRDGVGFLAESEAGAVSESEVAVQIFALGQRENAGGGDDAVRMFGGGAQAGEP